jgi:hypothetical protein
MEGAGKKCGRIERDKGAKSIKKGRRMIRK